MWGFEEARKASQAFLVDMEDSIAKVELATKYEYDDWLRKAYEELAKRPDPLSIEEVRRIGIEAAFHIAQVREDRLKALSCLRVLHHEVRMFGRNKHETYCPHCSNVIKASYSGQYSYACQPCGLTFFREKEPINQRIDERIRDKIRNLLPEKHVEVDDVPANEANEDDWMPRAAEEAPASTAFDSPFGGGALTEW